MKKIVKDEDDRDDFGDLEVIEIEGEVELSLEGNVLVIRNKELYIPSRWSYRSGQH